MINVLLIEQNETKKIKCKCKTKTEFLKLPNNEINLNELLHQFVDVIKHSNLFLFKCYKKVFSFEGFKNNSGSIINIIMILEIIFCYIFFVIEGYNIYKKMIQNLYGKKQQENEQNNTDSNNTNDEQNNTNSKNTNELNDLNNLNKNNNQKKEISLNNLKSNNNLKI